MQHYKCRGMSRVVIPRAYNERILSSKPSKRVCPFGIICGAKVALRSRGTAMGNSPKSPFNVFFDFPLRELPEFLPVGSCFS